MEKKLYFRFGITYRQKVIVMQFDGVLLFFENEINIRGVKIINHIVLIYLRR